jgi:hypothetical protein
MTKIITCSERGTNNCRKGNSPNARRMGNHNQEARCLQADSDNPQVDASRPTLRGSRVRT